MLDFSTSHTGTVITARQASHNLAHYLSEAAAGKSFTVVKHGKPMAKLVPAGEAHRTPQQQAAFDKKVAKALSFRARTPYGGKFNRMDAYADI